MPPEVLAAMNEAARCFVDLNELQRRVGERIAARQRKQARHQPWSDETGQAATGSTDLCDGVGHMGGIFWAGLRVGLALLRPVLGGFDGPAQRRISPGDQANHHARRDAEGGRAFRSIQHAKPSARARAHINQPASLRESLYDRLDDLRNFPRLRRTEENWVANLQLATQFWRHN